MELTAVSIFGDDAVGLKGVWHSQCVCGLPWNLRPIESDSGVWRDHLVVLLRIDMLLICIN